MSLTVTIQEDLILNGNDKSNTNVATFSCNELDHRIVTINNVEKSILLFGSANEAGTIESNHLRYLRITNLDASDTVVLHIRDTAQEFMVNLATNASFILTKDQLDADATGSEEVTALANITRISAKGTDSTSQSLEIYAASFFD